MLLATPNLVAMSAVLKPQQIASKTCCSRVVAKEAKVVEEVEDSTETVKNTVRRADVEIEELGSSYGESLASDLKHRGRDWHEVEGDAKADWENKHRKKGT